MRKAEIKWIFQSKWKHWGWVRNTEKVNEKLLDHFWHINSGIVFTWHCCLSRFLSLHMSWINNQKLYMYDICWSKKKRTQKYMRKTCQSNSLSVSVFVFGVWSDWLKVLCRSQTIEYTDAHWDSLTLNFITIE